MHEVLAGLDFSEKVCNSFPGDSDSEEFVIVVGPEGGFSTDELSRMEKQSFVGLNLGENVLRYETAVISGFVMMKTIFSENYFFYR